MPAIPASTGPDPRQPGIQSVATAMAVLEALAAGGGPMALSALAQAARLAPAKAHRYLAALAAAGMVAQRASGAYDLGPRAAALGMAAVARHDPVARASDALPGLVEQSGATAMLSVWGPHGATVSGSEAARKSSAWSENTTPKPKVASGGFCSITRRAMSGHARLIRMAA